MNFIVFFGLALDEILRGKKSILYRLIWHLNPKSAMNEYGVINAILKLLREVPAIFILAPILGPLYLGSIFVCWGLTAIVAHFLR